MADINLQKLAEVLVHYSLEIKPGEKLWVRALGDPGSMLRSFYQEAVKAGALIFLTHYSDDLQQAVIRYGTDEQITFMPDTEMLAMDYCDLMLALYAEQNTKASNSLDSAKLALLESARKEWIDRFLTRSASGDLRWCLTLLPTQASAQDAGMALQDYEDFVYGAMLLNTPDPVAAWRQVDVQQQRIADYLMKHDEIHIVAPGTDVTYRVGGRIWKNASGKVNFPDGEVFTGPLENSVNGYVTFSYPAIWRGKEVEDVRLEFSEGKCVKATAARGEEYLNAMLDMDEGARYVGEVAFGLNYGIQQFTRNLLFDEKIGGTMHMALGASYPETGGLNKSALHWDIVCDLHEGMVYADGEVCYEKGKFVI
ncbi:MAG: aminopeptidase [Anaerolineae bacterium]|nr:aminopeptidase [Anaerolineae bacterium]